VERFGEFAIKLRRMRCSAAFLMALWIASFGPGASIAQCQDTKTTSRAQPGHSTVGGQTTSGMAVKAPGDKRNASKEPEQNPPPNTTLIISGVSAAFVPLGTAQKLIINGTNFADGTTVILTEPDGSSLRPSAGQIKRLNGNQMEVTADFATEGEWKIVVQNPGGSPSPAASFKVEAALIPRDSPAVAAYQAASGVMTNLLIVLVAFVIIGLGIASFKGWSLGDALAEESSKQPAVITSKRDVIMVASSSRLIALLGLLGILTTVLGVGYALLWRLFVYGSTPDLTQARNFLFGSATLFAPYLANQVREVYSPSNPTPGKDSVTDSQAAAGARISGIDPPAPESRAAAQAVRLTGSGFQRGLVVSVTDPRGTSHSVTGNAVISVSPTLAAFNLVFGQPGEWRVTVTNPAESASDVFRFAVLGAPTISGLNPNSPQSNANAQKLILIGEGFMDGLAVALSSATAARNLNLAGAAIASVSPTQVVVYPILDVAGADWRAVVTNPGNRESTPFTFTAT